MKKQGDTVEGLNGGEVTQVEWTIKVCSDSKIQAFIVYH